MKKKVRLRIDDILKEKNPELYERYRILRSEAIGDIAGRQQRARDTSSGARHLDNVKSIIDKLVPSDKLDKMNDIECFILLSAIYLHDVGKIRELRFGGSGHHSSKSRELIVSLSREFKLENSEALAIGHIVEAHGKRSIENLPESSGVAPYGRIRIRYLAALLKLADDLDMTFTRASRLARAIVQPDSSIAAKWDMRQCVNNVDIDPETWAISVQATPSNEQQLSLLLKEVEIINERLADSKKYLRAIPDIALCYQIVDLDIDRSMLNQAKPSSQPRRTRSRSRRVSRSAALPDNLVAVLVNYDSVSMYLYANYVAPIIRDYGFHPLVIEDLPTEESLVERTIDIVSKSKFVMVLVAGKATPSLHIKLGVAMGTKRNILYFEQAGTEVVRELWGVEPIKYKNGENLKQLLHHRIKVLHKG